MPQRSLETFGGSLGSLSPRTLRGKIILPYLLVTLFVATAGVFVVVRLVTDSLYERLYNQLLDAGRVVAEEQVQFERRRLEVLRAVSNTRGVAQAVAGDDGETLAEIVPQIVANSTGVELACLLGRSGQPVFGWRQREGGVAGHDACAEDSSTLEDVDLVLAGVEDAQGSRRVALAQSGDGYVLYTIGPIYQGEEIVGAVLVGSDLDAMTVDLSETAVARVTLYDPRGQVLATTLGTVPSLQEEMSAARRGGDEVAGLQLTPERYGLVTGGADRQVPLQSVTLRGQNYLLAQGDWRLREESVGLFSVALPANFVVSAAATSRNLFSLLFAVATVAVFSAGVVLAGRLSAPLHRLAEVSTAVAEGDLTQRSGIEREDEIGLLARSFDAMTERLARNRRQLVAERSSLEAILYSIADGVLVFDQNRRLVVANPAAREFLEDTGLLDERSGGGRAVFDRMSMIMAEGGRLEARGHFFSGSVAPVLTPAAEQLGWVVVLRDVTREVEAEQLKDTFISSVSHELRTPLTSIKGYSDLLKLSAGPVLSDQQRRFIDVLQDNTAKLMEHVGKLIDMTELHSGTLALQRERTWLSALVREEADGWASRINEKGLAFALEMADADLWVDGDPARLKWVIDNLLQNAYEYTYEGGIRVRVGREDGQALVDIVDSGIGIRASDQPHVFDRFYRVQAEAAFDVYGLGLGLFVVRELVQAHGGQVTLKSKVGQGSVFRVTLPLLCDEEERARVDEGQGGGGAGDGQ